MRELIITNIKRIKRVITIVFGFTLLLIGLALLILPGPGLIIILLGLAILAIEFVWARTLLEHAKGYTKKGLDTLKGKKKVREI